MRPSILSRRVVASSALLAAMLWPAFAAADPMCKGALQSVGCFIFTAVAAVLFAAPIGVMGLAAILVLGRKHARPDVLRLLLTAALSLPVAYLGVLLCFLVSDTQIAAALVFSFVATGAYSALALRRLGRPAKALD